MAIGSSVLALGLAEIGRNMAELFAGFGTDLPWLTAVYVVISPVAPWLSLAVYVPPLVLLVRRNDFQGNPDSWTRFAIAGFGFFLLLLLLSWVAWYLPIFKLGSVV